MAFPARDGRDSPLKYTICNSVPSTRRRPPDMSLQAVLCLLRAGIRECKANTKQTVARSKRRDPFRASAVGVWFFLLAASAIWLPAQTATLTTFASDPYDSF